jgi:HlyD family secretion protein
MLKRKGVWIAGVAALLVILGFVALRRSQARSDWTFTTTRVDRGRIVAKVTASGSLSALVTVQVGSQVSGRLQKILVDFNSPVRKGELIAKIDPQLFEAAEQQAKANFLAAQGNLTKAEVQAVDADRQFHRSQTLAGRKLIAQADLDTAQATADVAHAQIEASKGTLEQARAGLHQAEVNLAYTNIYSPINGVVISRNVDVGQTVAASLQAPTLFVIAEDLRKMQVDTWVAEADIGRLQPGKEAFFTVDAYPGERFRGTVRQIRNSPQTQQNVVTYDAVIDIDNSALKLKPGMTANVTFVVADQDSVLRLPNTALRFHPPAGLMPGQAQGGARGAGGERGGPPGGQPGGPRGAGGFRAGPTDQHTVYVLSGKQSRPVDIHTGISDGTLTEVLEGGLAEGDLVITDASGGPRSAEGQAARPGGFGRLF